MPVYVNTVEISDDEIHNEMQYHPADSLDEAREKSAHALVIRQLLLQEATSAGVIKPSFYKYLNEAGMELVIESLLKQKVKTPEADEKTCQRFYSNNKSKFKKADSDQYIPFSEVKDDIKEYLEVRSERNSINEYIKTLANKAKIAGYKLD